MFLKSYIITVFCLFKRQISAQGFIFPDMVREIEENGFKLYPPEPCPGNEVFCGGDLQKYPLEIITETLNLAKELNISNTVRDRFFNKPSTDNKTITSDDVEILSPNDNFISKSDQYSTNLACGSVRKVIPNFARVKNVDGKWKYLAQMDKEVTQIIEHVICTNEDKSCVNDVDNPHGEGKTFCKQIHSTQKVLVLDAFGNITVDKIEIPSACLCHSKSGFGLRDGLRGRSSAPLISKTNLCLGSDDNSLKLDGKQSKNFEFRSNLDKQKESLARAAHFLNLTNEPCVNSEFGTICADQDVPNYPEKEVQLLLASRGLSQENFGKLFEAPCKPNIAQFTMIRGGILDFDENQLCTSRSDFSYPKKAKTVRGEWKYIVNVKGYKQGITIHKCVRSSIGHSCTYDGSIGHFPDATECKQIFKKHSFLAIDFDGSIQFDDFQIPTACACYIKDISPFKK